jgi:hypothetical protein
MILDTQTIANLFINVIVPQYKKSFNENWIDVLEESCATSFDVDFQGLGLTNNQSIQIVNMGPRVSNCFESLLKNVLLIKLIKQL